MTPATQSYSSLLQTYLRPHWRRTLVLLVLLLVGAGCTLLSPRILAAFIDAVFGGTFENMIPLGALFLLIALASQAVTVVTEYLGTDIGLRATNRLRTDLMVHCLHLDMDFHSGTTAGTLIERIDGDVGRLNQFLSTFSVLLIQNALLIGGALTAIALIDWRAGLVLGCFVLLALGALEISRRLAIPKVRRERETSAALYGVLEERLAGIEDLQANGGEGYVMRRFLEQSRPWARTAIPAHVYGTASWQVANVSYVLCMIAALSMAVWLVRSGAITIGAAYALYRYVELMRWPVNLIGRQVQDLQQAGAALVRLRELFSLRSKIYDTGTMTLPPAAMDVTLREVSFTYPDAEFEDEDTPRRATLNDLSFHLPAGRVLGLLGRTGSGKTTLTRLLLRFYEPHLGEICLGQHALQDIALPSLRERVGLVTQDVYIFNATVRDNLSLFDPAIPAERMLAAIEAVELSDWFRSLPLGLDTVLPPGGGMSGGQSQLLAVARVLLKDPGLVILDEASSRLDPATEQHLEHALRRLFHGRTVIIIAHRLQTVQRADDILILEQGRCAEAGERATLAADPESRFAQLMRVGMEDALA